MDGRRSFGLALDDSQCDDLTSCGDRHFTVIRCEVQGCNGGANRQLGERMPGGRVPHPHRPVVAGGGQAGSVGGPATAATAPVWPVRVRSSVPVAGSHSRTVSSCWRWPAGCPSGRPNATAVTAPVWPVRVRRRGAGGRVPQPHRAVAAGGGQHGAPSGSRTPPPTPQLGVAGEGARAGCRWPGPTAAPCRRRWRWPAGCPSGSERHPVTAPVWPVRGSRRGAGGRVPQPHRVVVAGGGQAGARRARTPPPSPRSVWPVRVRRRRAGGRVPQPHRAVVAGGGQAGAVGRATPPPSPRRCGR